jgi:hypothetical protein
MDLQKGLKMATELIQRASLESVLKTVFLCNFLNSPNYEKLYSVLPIICANEGEKMHR